MDMSTGAMGSLLPKLGALLVGGYNLQTGVKEDVEFLEREMRSMNAALIKVAKVPRDQLGNQVIVWADELRDLSYDMEDVVDNFLVCVEESESFANAIRDIKNRAQEMAYRRDRYKVDDDAAGKHKVDLRVVALYKDHKDIVGIKDARNKLTKKLRDGPEQQQHKMKIVSIVGPGGLGKTTLARAVYDRLQAHFEYKAFVPVGRNPEVKKVLRDILLEVDKSERMGDVVTLDEEQLIEKLRQLLENGRYFIVIDDIWDLKAWESIKCAFIDNNHRSRVITTTRILDVATNSGDIYKLEPLSQHLSEELFYTRLFGGKDKCLFDQPAEVLKKVLQKCGGVPLAIITIASLLAGKPMEDWSKVFNSIGFGSGDNNTDVGNTRKILLFSYYDLPRHLRSCLLHLSTYPEDYLINKNKLIWQWVAEGFVSEEPGVSLFETGERYFNELSNRSLIQPVEHPEKYKIYACRIHDMVLDTICVLSKEHNFVTILDSNEEHTPSQCNARRLAVQKRVVPLANMSMPKLRSWYAIMCDPNVVPSLSNFQVLRVLAMENCSFERDRPYTLEHIGRLAQLRYLSIESTNISMLPEEIGDLKFLQTLNLRGTRIKELPQRIGLLRKLKCLRADVYGDAGIRVSNWIGNLTSLEELYVHNSDKSSIFVKELRKLTELRVLICELTARMKKQYVANLWSLPKLTCLEGQRKYLILPRGMEFPDGAFPKLRSCRVRAPFRFLQGSMQSLEEIEIIWEVRALKDAGTDFDFIGSLGNLPSLRKVDARFFVNHTYTSDYEKVTDALWKAIDTHPNSPTLTTPITDRFLDYESDEEETDSEGFDDDDEEDEDEEESDSEQIERERMIEKLKKSGVFYKPGTMEEEEDNLYGDNGESANVGGLPRKEFVYQKEDSDELRTPKKINVQKDDDGVGTNSRGKTPYYCTLEYFDSFKGDSDDPIQVPTDVSDQKSDTSLGTDEIASHASEGSNGVQEVVEEVPGKRKRRVSKVMKSPFVVQKTKRTKRAAKGKLFQQEGVKKYNDDYDVVKASVKYIRAYEHANKDGNTEIFYDGTADALSAQRACQILNHQWLSGDVINAYASYLSEILDDRFMLPTWRVYWLMKIRPQKKAAGNNYEIESNSNGPVNRCADEYFKKAKTYIPLNKENTHWITVVMHSEKKEFQVLDSLMSGKLDSDTRKLVEDLRKELGDDILEAISTGVVNYPDVSTWPIKPYPMPQQEDGNSCGIFVLRCFQYWNGDEFTGLFSQRSIDNARDIMIAQIIFSERNQLNEVKDKVIRIAKKKK